MSTLKPIYVQYTEEAVHARHNRNFQVLASAASNLYNHFVHNPKDYINVESPLAVGSIFASCLGYQEPDEDIQEVRAENAIYCLTQSVESQNEVNRNLSAAYLFLVFSIFRKYTWQRMMKLFGAPELCMNMRDCTYFSLPKDVQAYILESDMNTDAKFNCVLSYLEQLMSEHAVLYLDLNEEKLEDLSKKDKVVSKYMETLEEASAEQDSMEKLVEAKRVQLAATQQEISDAESEAE